MNRRILLTGATGQVGSSLLPSLTALGGLSAPPRRELDLTDSDSLRRRIRDLRPAFIVNAAAYTAVDRAESEPAVARAINAEAPAILAEEASHLGAILIHYSTDYVFDGSKRTPYEESDPPNPLNVYGATKLEGEHSVRSLCPRHFIFRTSWVYAPRGRNFLLTILKLATDRRELRIVSDQLGAPTSASEIARATCAILASLPEQIESSDSAFCSVPFGTYHMTAGGAASWYEFACSILELARQNTGSREWVSEATAGRPLIADRVVPITSREYPTAARRPAYSILSTDKLARTFSISMPDWKSQLRAVFGQDESEG